MKSEQIGIFFKFIWTEFFSDKIKFTAIHSIFKYEFKKKNV